MIYIDMSGGAGNQYAQYAFARYLMIHRGGGEKLIINFRRLRQTRFNNYMGDHLADLNTVPYEARNEKVHRFYIRRIVNKLVQKAKFSGWVDFLSHIGMYNYHTSEYSEIVSKHRNVFVSGNFENPIYYRDIRATLLRELCPCAELSDTARQLVEKIRNAALSICISVRRWPEEQVNDRRIQLSVEYYEKGLQYIRNQISVNQGDTIVLFISSNDMAWAQDNLNFEGYDVVFDQIDLAVYEKVAIMKECQNFVLSNSSFSWWVQYLAEYEDKIVVMPYCPTLGYFQYKDAPGGVKTENWFLLNPYTGDREGCL